MGMKEGSLQVRFLKMICSETRDTINALDQETLCPAIFIKGETVQINDKYCVDCKACKIVCPYRAIK